ncbi:MAG: M3 family metallopeptidase [Bacteroidales bacterium]|nr:M3 family metallopeptidase [Bacteroidales bacterium]
MKEHQNPFMTEYTTKYKIPPFEKIAYSDYVEAVKAGIEQHNAEIRAIIVRRDRADFDNTILALDNSGRLLSKVQYVYYALAESDGTPEMEKVSEVIRPLLTAHSDEVSMNAELFKKVKAVYDNQKLFNLTRPQQRLLEKTYMGFVRNGALLSDADKKTLMELNQEIAAVQMQFNQNLQKENNTTEVVVEDAAELAGLPESTIAEAASQAAARGKEGKWVFTVHAPSRLAVLSYADSRALRERMYKAYMSIGSKNNEYNNYACINKIIQLRIKKANLLGYDTFADMMMARVMSKTVENAENLLYQIWKPAVAKAHEEIADMQKYINNHGGNFKLAAWDYYYYAEKVKKERFNLSEDEVRPYFQLDNVVKGLFAEAGKLFGITFTEMPKAPKYNPEVKVYDVKDAKGNHVAVFMTDYFPRATKRQGAWMSEFQTAYNYEGVVERPIIYNVGNFTKPTKDMPSLLTVDEVETAFHEFGHALQGMLTTAQFRGIAGTNIDRDAVELASQFNEHWKFEPELLKIYAKHYKTGEVIPEELVKKLEASAQFNMGFRTTELCGAALLDIEWHKMNYAKEIDVEKFEKAVARRLGMPEEIQFRYRSPYFKHIFGSDEYAAGYYTYLWAEVLSADAASLFEEKGMYDAESAKAYLENILQAGDSEDAMTLYKRFRGREPQVDALLRDRGLK